MQDTTMVKSSFEIASAADEEHDEYWDGDFEDDAESDESDDEEAFDGTPNGLSSSGSGTNGHHADGGKKKAKMKKMKVTTQRDYAASNAMINMLLYNPRCRGICCISSIGVILMILFVKLIIPESSATSGNSEQELPECQVPTTNKPLSEWMHLIRKANDTTLCRPEVGIAVRNSFVGVLFCFVSHHNWVKEVGSPLLFVVKCSLGCLFFL